MSNDSSSNDTTYQSDHNPVYGYFPGLIDNQYNVAIITYNEKGQTTTPTAVDQFLLGCVNMQYADLVIAGIQEGDSKTIFINTLSNKLETIWTQYNPAYNTVNTVNKEPYLYSAPILTNAIEPEQPYNDTNTASFASNAPNENTNTPQKPISNNKINSKMFFGGGGNQNNITTKAITYKSFGKECKSVTNKVCLLNGLYVYIRPNLAHILNINPDYGTSTLNSIPFFSKHIAWVCIESSTTKSQYVFFSCHLEYNGSSAYAPTGFKYPQRKVQLDSYISSMTDKFPDAELIMCLGDTNMRTLYGQDSKRDKYVIDQMLVYLLQVNPEYLSSFVNLAYLAKNNPESYETDYLKDINITHDIRRQNTINPVIYGKLALLSKYSAYDLKELYKAIHAPYPTIQPITNPAALNYKKIIPKLLESIDIELLKTADSADDFLHILPKLESIIGFQLELNPDYDRLTNIKANQLVLDFYINEVLNYKTISPKYKKIIIKILKLLIPVINRYYGAQILTKLHNTITQKNIQYNTYYAPYCINPEFTLNNTTYHAYDFTYKPNTAKSVTTLDTIYAYPPTAIYKISKDYAPNDFQPYHQEFDMTKREKSGGILAPSHTDRILMFRPVHTFSKKINFMVIN